MGKRRCEIANNRVLRVRRDDRGGVLVVMGLLDCLDGRPDVSFIFRVVSFYGRGCHGASPLFCCSSLINGAGAAGRIISTQCASVGASVPSDHLATGIRKTE